MPRQILIALGIGGPPKRDRELPERVPRPSIAAPQSSASPSMVQPFAGTETAEEEAAEGRSEQHGKFSPDRTCFHGPDESCGNCYYLTPAVDACTIVDVVFEGQEDADRSHCMLWEGKEDEEMRDAGQSSPGSMMGNQAEGSTTGSGEYAT